MQSQLLLGWAWVGRISCKLIFKQRKKIIFHSFFSHNNTNLQCLEWSSFVSFIVAENLTLRGNLYIDAVNGMEVSVAPLYDYQLKKFQVICWCWFRMCFRLTPATDHQPCFSLHRARWFWGIYLSALYILARSTLPAHVTMIKRPFIR